MKDRSGTRRSTRSQVAPDWNSTDELILVNEIAAVEADCLKALSSFQKWKIIAQNCSALGVPRPLNQYRRKWDALFLQYKTIKQWESQSGASGGAGAGGGSYWDMEIERRKTNGLPENLDHELFRAIGNLESMRENHGDTDPDSDPDSDPEALVDEADNVTDIEEPESKKRRRRSTPQKSCPRERSCKVEKPRETRAEEKPQETHAEDKPMGSSLQVDPGKIQAEEKPQKSCVKENQKNCLTKEEAINIEEQEKIMTIKLKESAELIHAIVTENPDHDAADVKSTGDLQTDFVRRQGDLVIECLEDMVKTLNQLRHLAQECE